MKILAIESSCDETAAAVVFGDLDSVKVLSNVVVSQIDIFKEYGGVIPEVAARSHLEAVMPVVHKAMDGMSWDEIDAIAVTHTPGLLGSLLVGTLTARTLAILHNKPLYAVHHLKSHIYANWINVGSGRENTDSSTRRSLRLSLQGSDGSSSVVTSGMVSESVFSASIPVFPLLALVVSGGHTQIIYMREHNHFEIIGTTQDDAVGECFDKAAKILGLPYPGGPAISAAAENGDENKYRLPHPNVAGLDFSFSGLKTAVLRAVQKEVGVPISYPSHQLAELLTEQQIADFSASFEKTAAEILGEKIREALKLYPDAKSVVVAGGVAANKKVRQTMEKYCSDVPVYFPELKYSGDNAAMVGAAAYYEIASGVSDTDPYKLDIMPRSAIM